MKIEQSILHVYPVGQKFRQNHSISHGLGDTSNFKFYHFCQNSKIQNGCHFWKEEKFLKIKQSILHIYPVGPKFHRNRSILFWRYKQFKVLPFLSKIQNGRHFWKEKNFLRIEQSILDIYPVGQKFRRNRFISHGLGDTSNLKFYHFCQKCENSKWPPFLEREKF